jgi:hypothetical protein
MQSLAELARLVAEAPWTLSAAHRTRWHAAGLADDDVLHAIALASYFGHLNRIADAVAVPLDYQVREVPPHADRTTPALAAAPRILSGATALDLASRRATDEALGTWEAALYERETPLPRADRTTIVALVARLLGDGAVPPSAHALAPTIARLAEQVTLAPWQLGDESYGDLRSTGATDAYLFDIVITTTTAGVRSRIRTALTALAR